MKHKKISILYIDTHNSHCVIAVLLYRVCQRGSQSSTAAGSAAQAAGQGTPIEVFLWGAAVGIQTLTQTDAELTGIEVAPVVEALISRALVILYTQG